MGQPIAPSLRLEIVKSRQDEKLSYRDLAARFKVNYHTARNLCLSYERRGEAALVPGYSNCGRRVKPEAEKAYRLVRLISHFHPGWGVPYITTKIAANYPGLALQSERHYQRRLKKDCPKIEIPPPTIPRESLINDVRQAHDEWQIDAKEQVKLEPGGQAELEPSGQAEPEPSGQAELEPREEACYLNITDTKSHALLKAKTFPPGVDPASFFAGDRGLAA